MTAMLDPLDVVRDALNVAGCDPRGSDRISARCPAHDDRNPSLTVGRGTTQPVVLRCHAGCETDAILSALDLKSADICEPNGDRSNGLGPVVAEYFYTDEQGRPLVRVTRFAGKEFRQARYEGGAWVNGLGDVRRVLYRLPEVILAADASDMIWITEGEKDADRMRAEGVTATTSLMGAGKWRPEYSTVLAGATVTIVADRDKSGADHAVTVARSLESVDADVTIVEAADGKDASDHLAAGHGLDGFRTVTVAELQDRYRDDPKGEPDTTRTHPVDMPGRHPFTDLGNARRLVAIHGADLRHAPQLGVWLVWDDTRWAEDVTGEVHRRAKKVADGLLGEPTDGAADLRALVRHWERSQHAARLAAMVSVASTEPGIPITIDRLDADPWSLNCANGTVDLRTGVLRPHRRADLITKTTGVPFEPDAPAPTWERFLSDIFADDLAVIEYVQRLVGYSITGLVSEQKMPIGYGSGANGKTTFINAVAYAFGDYATALDPTLLMASDHPQHPTGLLDLRGARFVSTVEVEQGHRLSEALVKKLTGGEPIPARRMHKDYVTFMPSHKLWMACNYLPRVRGTDLGIWRRLLVVPFLVTFDGQRCDPQLPDKLQVEAPGILAWAITGARLWAAYGLEVPARVRAATDQYRGQQDHLGRFLAECCVIGDDRSVKAKDLRDRYVGWCEAEGERPWTQASVGAELSKRGLDRVQVGREKSWTWIGIGVTRSTLGSNP
jgi:putative DNA primase/helicase